jgi:hypothetical protein
LSQSGKAVCFPLRHASKSRGGAAAGALIGIEDLGLVRRRHPEKRDSGAWPKNPDSGRCSYARACCYKKTIDLGYTAITSDGPTNRKTASRSMKRQISQAQAMRTIFGHARVTHMVRPWASRAGTLSAGMSSGRPRATQRNRLLTSATQPLDGATGR